MIQRRLLGSLLLLTGALAAQNPLPLQGFLYNWDRPQLGDALSIFTRSQLGPEEVLSRIDRDDYRDWGLDANGRVSLQGYVTWILDVNDATRENYSIVGYAENAAQPNFPNTTARAFTVGPIPMPPTGTTPGQVAWRVASTFTQPVTMPSTGDVFVGVSCGALSGTTSVTDGLFVGTTNADNTAAPPAVFDLPGPRGALNAGIAQQSYVCYVRGTTPFYFPANATSLDQLAFDVFLSGSTVGGVALTQTNQTSYVSSNAAPLGPGGTSNFLSGLHPDLNGFNQGRADNVGFAVTTGTSQVPAPNPVFVLLAFGPSPLGSLPLTQIAGALAGAGSAGNVCVDFTTAATFLMFLGNGQPGSFGIVNEGQLVLQLNAGTRAALAALPGPIDFWWQGFAIDTTAAGPGFEIRTTGCAVQHLK